MPFKLYTILPKTNASSCTGSLLVDRRKIYHGPFFFYNDGVEPILIGYSLTVKLDPMAKTGCNSEVFSLYY